MATPKEMRFEAEAKRLMESCLTMAERRETLALALLSTLPRGRREALRTALQALIFDTGVIAP